MPLIIIHEAISALELPNYIFVEHEWWKRWLKCIVQKKALPFTAFNPFAFVQLTLLCTPLATRNILPALKHLNFIIPFQRPEVRDRKP